MLDFSKRKKKYFDITLHDGTKLKIPCPTVAIFDAMKDIAESSDTEELSELTKKILDANKQGIKITPEHMQEFDFDDIKELFVEYANFVRQTLSDPNLKSPITP